MTYHAMFSLYIMTGLLALVISVSLFCKSIAEAKEWKKKFGERNWDYRRNNPVVRLHLVVLEGVFEGRKNHKRGIREPKRQFP